MITVGGVELIRKAALSDAKDLSELIYHVENNSTFLLYEPGERQFTEDKQRHMIKSLTAQDNSALFVAEKQKKLVGYLIVIGGSAKRTRHSAYLAIGIHPEFRGQGVGTELFVHLEKWAGQQSVNRLELTVVCENSAGVALYKKHGFEVEGTKRDSLYINGNFYDEYYMSKLI